MLLAVAIDFLFWIHPYHHGLSKSEFDIFFLLVLWQEYRAELVLDNANSLTLTLPLVSSLYSVGFYCRQSSLLSREHITPLPVWLAPSNLVLANFTSFLWCCMICAKVFIQTEFNNHIVVENMATCGDQDESNKDISDTSSNIGLVQPGRSRAHCKYWHETKVKWLHKCPGVKLGHDGSTGGDVTEEQQDDDDNGASNVGSAGSSSTILSCW